MSFFQRMHKPTLFLWVLLLSVALLCAQGVKLHIHSFGHDHELRHNIAPEVATGHLHQSGIHLTTDVSHATHHDEVISEQGLNSQALLKKMSSYGPMLTIFLIAFIFLFHRLSVITLHYIIVVTKMSLLFDDTSSPPSPLRAPPV
jgi:hypothetical protein